MPTTVTEILGRAGDPGFAQRRICPVDITWGDARKHRQVARAVDGRELEIRLPRGSFLFDGAVLADDGEEIVVVRRPVEDAVVVDFAENAGVDGVRGALLLGYWLGNQHAPLEVSEMQLRTPLFTGPATARETLERMGINGTVGRTALATQGWTNTSADHHHGHDHD
ncbi:urease accessory protein UreE [Mycolicibacterium sp. S2-37]|uniref:urease accessory protein UreE n=1 Tax=Mycolicibacterium sp. S2-37 TaxID=2810297 RepID=UPI001A94CA0C|nr:urease accessory protein UreE [Mycolicibacterium sp. S2-37]MBO0681012.1 urease accessory protein UreE [Mycolicibacterium sp. S2-37]